MSAHSESEPVGKSDRVLRGQEVKGDMVDAPTGKLFGKSKTKVKEESKYDERVPNTSFMIMKRNGVLALRLLPL